jgi:outer membrane protein TolC
VWRAGLVVDPGFDRVERRAELLQSLTRRDAQALAVADLEREVEIDVKREIRAYRRALANHTIALRNTDLAAKRLELAEAMYRMGSVENVNVSDAETAFADATASELAARAEASLAGYRALRSMGTLVEAPHDLRP